MERKPSRIVIACDSFKDALPARQVCEAIARGIRRANPNTVMDICPLADGGEGTVDTLVQSANGEFRYTPVTGPLDNPIKAKWCLCPHASPVLAVLEMAAASGLEQVPFDQRDPTRTTTLGTGELIRAALDADARDILIGIGGSATTDGGVGAAQAIGIRFFDEQNQPLPPGLPGGLLHRISRIDISQRDPRIKSARIRVASDVANPLCGEHGAAVVFGPQKGATPTQVQHLDHNLAHLAQVIQRDLNMNVIDHPGAGAAGGLGAGLMAFFDATLCSGIELVLETLHFAERIAQADWVITGEGRLDSQSAMGKVIAGVGAACRNAGIPLFAFTGCVGTGIERLADILTGYHIITPTEMPLSQALPQTAELLELAAFQWMSQSPVKSYSS